MFVATRRYARFPGCDRGPLNDYVVAPRFHSRDGLRGGTRLPPDERPLGVTEANQIARRIAIEKLDDIDHRRCGLHSFLRHEGDEKADPDGP
jgi:hypothetical protein